MIRYYDSVTGFEFDTKQDAFDFLAEEYDTFTLLQALTTDDLDRIITALQALDSDLIDELIANKVEIDMEERIYWEEEDEEEDE